MRSRGFQAVSSWRMACVSTDRAAVFNVTLTIYATLRILAAGRPQPGTLRWVTCETELAAG